MEERTTIDKSRHIHTWGEFCEIIKGNGVQKVDFVDEGYGCIHYGQIYTHYGPYTYNTNKFVSKEIFDKAKKASKGDIIMTDTSENVEDICKSVAYLGNDDIAVSNHALIIKHNQNPKFLSYSTQTDSFFNQKRKVVVGVKVSGIKPEQLAKIKIYLPSLSEQERIVGILDTFTASIDNLKERIAQRRKQYEYYRNQLLDLEGKEGVEMKTLGDIGDVCMCKRIMKEQTSEKGEIPFFKIGTFGYHADAYISKELFDEYKSKYSYPRKGEILISASGTIGRSVVFDGGDAYFQDSNIVWIANDEKQVSNRYLYYFYQVVEWKTDGGTIKRLYNYNLKSTIIPLPSLSEQQRIVSILDTFEASIQNLEAQLSQREKQYEYYRNKLLKFE